jgi:hypothetical protein
MSVDECARLIVSAAAKRKREVVMTRTARMGLVLKSIAPGIVDSFAERTVRRGR